MHLGLEKFMEHKLYTMVRKYSFAQLHIEYLGHIIYGGVSTDPSKTTTMLQWPVPTFITELRGFLGLTDILSRTMA